MEPVYRKINAIAYFADSTYYYCNGDTLASSHTNSQQGGGCNNTGPENSTDVASRSPLAATRASSGASAASPTGSACTKPDHTSTPTDLYLAWLIDGTGDQFRAEGLSGVGTATNEFGRHITRNHAEIKQWSLLLNGSGTNSHEPLSSNKRSQHG